MAGNERCGAETNRKDWPYVAVCFKTKGHDGFHQSRGLYRWVDDPPERTEP